MNVSPPSNDYAAALSNPSIALTPGSIMLMLRRRMSDMDGQIDHIMNEIETNTSRSEGIQKQVEALTLIKSAMANQQPDATEAVRLDDITVTWGDDKMTATELINRLGIPIDTGNEVVTSGIGPEGAQEAITHFENREEWLAGGGDDGLSPEDQERLIREARGARAGMEAVADGRSAVFGSETLTGNSIDSTIQAAQSAARRMNSGNEVAMVQMQSVMQQRSQAVTMATQMLKSINDSSNAIAQNIGR